VNWIFGRWIVHNNLDGREVLTISDTISGECLPVRTDVVQ